MDELPVNRATIFSPVCNINIAKYCMTNHRHGTTSQCILLNPTKAVKKKTNKRIPLLYNNMQSSQLNLIKFVIREIRACCWATRDSTQVKARLNAVGAVFMPCVNFGGEKKKTRIGTFHKRKFNETCTISLIAPN